MGTAGRCYRGWERSALPLAALTALLLIDVCKVSRIKNPCAYETGGYCCSQPLGQWKSQKREQAQLLPESAVLAGAGIPALLLHYYLMPLLHLGIASPEPTLFPRGLHLNFTLMLCGKQKEHHRHFLCSVLEGSEMEPFQALGTRPGHSPRTRPACSGDRRSGP